MKTYVQKSVKFSKNTSGILTIGLILTLSAHIALADSSAHSNLKIDIQAKPVASLMSPTFCPNLEGKYKCEGTLEDPDSGPREIYLKQVKDGENTVYTIESAEDYRKDIYITDGVARFADQYLAGSMGEMIGAAVFSLKSQCVNGNLIINENIYATFVDGSTMSSMTQTKLELDEQKNLVMYSETKAENRTDAVTIKCAAVAAAGVVDSNTIEP